MNHPPAFRWSPLGVAAVGVLLGLGLGVASQPMAAAAQPASAQQAPAQAKAAMTVTVASPTRQPLAQTLSATGSLAAWQEAVVGAEVPGLRLVAVPVDWFDE